MQFDGVHTYMWHLAKNHVTSGIQRIITHRTCESELMSAAATSDRYKTFLCRIL